jgi:hypothetical protein
MATYHPPTETLPIFDPAVFTFGTEGLTINRAGELFLKYPNAQGEENLQAINVNGLATFNSTSIFNNNIDMNNHNITDTGQLVFNNGGVPQTQTNAYTGAGAFSGSYTSSNLTIDTNGKITAISNGTGANPNLTAVLTAGNSAGGLNITSVGDIGASTLTITDSTNTLIIDQTGIDTTIKNNQTDGTIFLQTENASGTLIDTLSINSGSNGIVVGSNVKLDMNSQMIDQIGSAIYVVDGTTQTSAYTGAGALTGSYTNTNMTIDADGKITAISNGSGGATPNLSAVLTAGNSAGSQAITGLTSIGFATTTQTSAYTGLTTAGNYTNTNINVDANGKITGISSGSGGVSNGFPYAKYSVRNTTIDNIQSLWINASGGPSGAWAQNSCFTIRLSASFSWNFTGSGSGNALNNSTTTGYYDIYPYRFSPNWCARSNAIRYGNMSTNAINGNSSFGVVDTSQPGGSGSTICPYGRQFWGYDLVNAGSTPSTCQICVSGSSGSMYITLVNPSGWTGNAPWNAELTIELVNVGAGSTSITTSGFQSATF